MQSVFCWWRFPLAPLALWRPGSSVDGLDDQPDRALTVDHPSLHRLGEPWTKLGFGLPVVEIMSY